MVRSAQLPKQPEFFFDNSRSFGAWILSWDLDKGKKNDIPLF
jgi:hypothetical protein